MCPELIGDSHNMQIIPLYKFRLNWSASQFNLVTKLATELETISEINIKKHVAF